MNCIVVSNEEELAKVMNVGIPEELYDIILQNSKKIIEDHLVVEWFYKYIFIKYILWKN